MAGKASQSANSRSDPAAPVSHCAASTASRQISSRSTGSDDLLYSTRRAVRAERRAGPRP